MKILPRKHAFTLIELLVVISILGVLFAITSYTVASVAMRSRNDTRKQDLKHMQTALEQFATDQRSYPAFDSTLVANNKPVFSAVWQLSASPTCAHTTTNTKNLSPSYLLTIPEDPSQTAKFAALGCSSLTDNQTMRYLYIASTPGSAAGTYGLMTTLEGETAPDGSVINGNLTTNAPYQYTANPFASTSTLFGSFYSAHLDTNVAPNYILTGGATR